jgi:hypothetical protein
MAITYNQIVSTTLPFFDKVCTQQVYEKTALLNLLKKRSRVVADGGYEYRSPVRYRKFDQAKMTDPDAARNTILVESRTDLVWQVKFAVCDQILSWEEAGKNSGAEQVISLIKDKTQEQVEDMAHKMSSQIYQVYASIGSHDLNSLIEIIDSTSQTSYGGLSTSDAADNTSGVYDTSTTSLSLYGGTGSMWYLWQKCSELMPITHFVTTEAIAGTYASKLQPGERRMPENGDAGATDLSYNGVPILIDHHCPSNYIMALNLDQLYFFVHPKYNFSIGPHQDDPDRYNAIRWLLSFQGNLGTPARRCFGGYAAITG